MLKKENKPDGYLIYDYTLDKDSPKVIFEAKTKAGCISYIKENDLWRQYKKGILTVAMFFDIK